MKLILKSFLFLFLLSSPTLAASGKPFDNRIEFAIYRGGDQIGTHIIEFTKLTKGRTQVDISINMLVKLGPVPVFRYQHTNREIWAGNKPIRVDTKTNDDGELFEVSGMWREGFLLASTKSAERTLAGNVLPSSYWNPETLKANMLLNTQTGEEKPIHVQALGRIEVETENGIVQAKRYAVTSKQSFMIDYDIKTNQWVGLTFSVRGSDLSYRRLDPL